MVSIRDRTLLKEEVSQSDTCPLLDLLLGSFIVLLAHVKNSGGFRAKLFVTVET